MVAAFGPRTPYSPAGSGCSSRPPAGRARWMWWKIKGISARKRPPSQNARVGVCGVRERIRLSLVASASRSAIVSMRTSAAAGRRKGAREGELRKESNAAQDQMSVSAWDFLRFRRIEKRAVGCVRAKGF